MSFRSFPLLARVAAAGAILLLGACSSVRTPVVQVAPAPMPRPKVVAAAPAPPASTGAIFQGQAYRPLFEDIRARAVGDLLTVSIQENTTARQRSNTSVNREGKLEGAVTALPFVTSPALPRARIGASTSNDSTSKGESGSDNLFTGTITATVVEVLPNGNLLVVGEKQVGVNQTIDTLRFSGVVDPRSIRPGNSVASTQLADVRVEFRGKGDIDRAMTVGWLQRFFFSFSPL
jgi:flagellar L-ring protein precursor FlgH